MRYALLASETLISFSSYCMLKLHICVRVFSGAIEPRAFELGIPKDTDMLYHGTENRPHGPLNSRFMSSPFGIRPLVHKRFCFYSLYLIELKFGS